MAYNYLDMKAMFYFLSFLDNERLCFTYFIVLSQLPVTKRLISGIQAISFMGASCMATVLVWPPDIKDHILTCLSQPPENTDIPSSFQVEHKTYMDCHILEFIYETYYKLHTSLNIK